MHKARGFTLIEILIVIAIIGVVAAIVAARMVTGGNQAKIKLTRTTIAHVVASVETYSLDIGRPPERLDDLVHKPAGASNWTGPYVDERDLSDAWGRKLVYRNPGERREFDVISYGGDGKPGGEGAQAEDVAIR
jgi:general secretion pathway protein G